jgi:NADH-quinone oxidoreductase chain G
MIKLKIDDRDVEVLKPVTVLEAAASVGIKIPTLCAFEGLDPFAGCRMCVVEIEKVPRLQTACTVKVTDGMVVKTETESVQKARKAMLEFLLINHPLDCPVCDKAGECKLQDLVAVYGATEGRFLEGKRKHPESYDDPMIVRNMERCILCTRCVRMCDGVQGAYAITVTGRSNHSFVEPFSGGKYNCEYCGNCLTVCPVGAIMSRLHRHSYRPWYVEKEIPTVCGHCGVGCSMYVQMRGNGIIRTMPRFGLGLNNGILCVRGRFGYDFVETDGRLKTPVIKQNGKHEAVTWKESASYTAKRLTEIKNAHGANSIAAIASGRVTNEANYMLQKLIRFVVGTNNIDSAARSYYAPALSYLERMFGQGVTANLITGVAQSDGVFVLGGDPTAINPVLGVQARIAWKNGAKIVVLGMPGGLKRFVEYDLTPVPFSEEIVLSAIVGRLMAKKGLSGHNDVVEDKLKKLRLPTEDEIKSTGLMPSVIERAADELAAMKNPSVLLGPEIIQKKRSSKNIFLAGAVMYLINARLLLMSEKANYQGLIDMGCTPDCLPGGRPLEFEMLGHKMEEAIGMKVPQEKGLTLFEMILQAESGQLKALYIMGENPLFNLPDKERTKKALEKLEFLVVQDIFMTETAQMADVVFPASSWSEKNGTFTNLGRMLQRVRKCKNVSPGWEDWRIIAEVARNMGMPDSATGAYLGEEDVWREIVKVSPVHKNLTYDDIEGLKGMWPYLGEPLRGMEGDFPVEGLQDLPEIKREERLRLLPEHPLFHLGTLSRHSRALKEIYPSAHLTVNPLSAERFGLHNGDVVRAATARGSVELPLMVSLDVTDGIVYLSNTFENAGAMGLLNYATDAVTGSLQLDDNFVTLLKVLDAPVKASEKTLEHANVEEHK